MWDQIGLLGIIALSVFAAGFVQSAMGFGYAVTSLAVMCFFVDVHLANLIVSLSSLLPMALAFYHYRHDVVWRDLGGALMGAAVALPVGLLVFKYVPGDWLVRGTGVVILVITIDGLRKRNPVAPVADALTMNRSLGSCAAGAVSGFLSGAVSIGGPPVAAYVVRQAWTPSRMKGFLVGFMLLLGVYKAGGLVVGQLLDWQVIVWSAVVAPVACVGTSLGVIASRNLDAQRFRQIALLMLALMSVNMLVRGNAGKTPAAEDGGSVARIVLHE